MVQVLERLAAVNTCSYTDYGAPSVSAPSPYAAFYGFNGEEHDPLTGLQYLRARYYDAETGSFISQDPYAGTLQDPLSQNRYTYAENNPINYADPSGYSVWSSIKSGVSKAANAVAGVAKSVGSAIKSVFTPKPAAKPASSVTAVNSALSAQMGNAAKQSTVPTWSAAAVQNSVTAASVYTPAQKSIYTPFVPTLVPAHFDDPAAAAVSYIAARGCDATLKKVCKQEDVSGKRAEISSKLSNRTFIELAALGAILSFAQGVGSAVLEDWAKPARDLGAALVGIETPELKISPWYGDQNAFALGRGAGHLVSMLSGLAGAFASLAGIGGGAAGGAILAPATGGASLTISVAAAAEGSVALGYSVSVVLESALALFDDPNIQFSKQNGGKTEAAQSKENVLNNESSHESARNTLMDQLDETGAFADGSAPYIGRLESSYGYGKQIGRQSFDGKVRWRLDYDPDIGVHYNIEDFTNGKGANAVKTIIPIDISYEEYMAIIDSWN